MGQKRKEITKLHYVLSYISIIVGLYAFYNTSLWVSGFVFLVPLFLIATVLHDHAKKPYGHMLYALIAWISFYVWSYIDMFGVEPTIIVLVIVAYTLLFMLFYYAAFFSLYLVLPIYVITYGIFEYTLGAFWMDFAVFFPVSSIFPYVGSFGASLMLVASNIIVVVLLKNPKKCFYFLLTLIIAFSVLMIHNESVADVSYTESNRVELLAIQGNLNKDWFWRYEHMDYVFAHYKKETVKGLANHPQAKVVIWPEYIVTGPIELMYSKWEDLYLFTERHNISLVFGGVGIEENGHKNILYILTSQGVETYEAEYVYDYFHDALPGESRLWNGTYMNVGFGLCYEEYFTKHFTQFAYADIFIVTANAHFVKDNRQEFLLRFTQNIARVYQKPILRLQNTGLTAYIDEYGNVLDTLPLRSTEHLYVSSIKHGEASVYGGYKYFIDSIYICGAIGYLILLYRKIPDIKKRKR